MNVLGLLRGGSLASANGPDGLVGQYNPGPVGNLGVKRDQISRLKKNTTILAKTEKTSAVNNGSKQCSSVT